MPMALTRRFAEAGKLAAGIRCVAANATVHEPVAVKGDQFAVVPGRRLRQTPGVLVEGRIDLQETFRQSTVQLGALFTAQRLLHDEAIADPPAEIVESMPVARRHRHDQAGSASFNALISSVNACCSFGDN